MPVKLDVLVNYIFNNEQLKRQIASINKRMRDVTNPLMQSSVLRYNRNNVKELLTQSDKAAEHFNKTLKNTLSYVIGLNKTGGLSNLAKYYGLETDDKGRIKDKKALKGIANQFASSTIQSEIQNVKDEEKKKETKFHKNLDSFIDFEKELENAEKKVAKEKLTKEAKKEKIQADYWLARQRYEKKVSKDEEKKKNKLFNLLLMRWGKFGIAGIAISKTIQLATSAARIINTTTQQGLDWQRTISGGASGGSFFGQGLAGFQRVGLGHNQYQGFKRGIQSYIGGLKLGQGNAAPLMYLGINALDSLDETEKQIERALRSAPKDISLALASQMGIDYNMWEAIYSGKLEKAREKEAYDVEAIAKWAAVAENINNTLTDIKVFLFNNLSDFVYNITHPTEMIKEGTMFDNLLNGLTLTNPLLFHPAAALVKVKIDNNTNDDVQVKIDNAMQEYGS